MAKASFFDPSAAYCPTMRSPSPERSHTFPSSSTLPHGAASAAAESLREGAGLAAPAGRGLGIGRGTGLGVGGVVDSVIEAPWGDGVTVRRKKQRCGKHCKTKIATSARAVHPANAAAPSTRKP